MRQNAIGMILVFIGAAVAAIGAYTIGSEIDKLTFFAIIFLFVNQNMGLGFLIAIILLPDYPAMLVWAGVGIAVIGGIVAAAK